MPVATRIYRSTAGNDCQVFSGTMLKTANRGYVAAAATSAQNDGQPASRRCQRRLEAFWPRASNPAGVPDCSCFISDLGCCHGALSMLWAESCSEAESELRHRCDILFKLQPRSLGRCSDQQASGITSAVDIAPVAFMPLLAARLHRRRGSEPLRLRTLRSG